MIAIKPHHFIDILTTFGAGQTEFQPHPYGHAVHSIAREILASLDIDLCIEFGADEICRPCRHNLDGHCDDTIDTSFRPLAPGSKREYNLFLDQRWSERLGIRPGDQLTAREFCLRLLERMGDITDIYRETPIVMTQAREEKLRRGLAQFLGESKTEGERAPGD